MGLRDGSLSKGGSYSCTVFGYVLRFLVHLPNRETAASLCGFHWLTCSLFGAANTPHADSLRPLACCRPIHQPTSTTSTISSGHSYVLLVLVALLAPSTAGVRRADELDLVQFRDNPFYVARGSQPLKQKGRGAAFTTLTGWVQKVLITADFHFSHMQLYM